jgi:transposase
MLALAPHVRIFIACGMTDMRKGFDGLAARIEHDLKANPYGGALYIFRGRRGDIVKALYWDGQGLVLYAKRLEKGHFTWPQAKDGVISLTTAQLSMLTEGIDWRMPNWSARPTAEHDA